MPSDVLEASDARFAYCEAMHRKGRASLEGFLQATREELSKLSLSLWQVTDGTKA
jgi:hypothetical protein